MKQIICRGNVFFIFLLFFFASCAHRAPLNQDRESLDVRKSKREGRFFSYDAPTRTRSEKDSAGPPSVAFNQNLKWPVAGRLSSPFGPRGWSFHDGVDIAAPRGTPITSVAKGRVSHVGFIKGYGRTVIIQHKGFTSLYAHCHRTKVRPGQKVREGQFIATVGTTGRARGAHLHFEVRDNDNIAFDPFGGHPQISLSNNQHYTRRPNG